MVSVAAINFTQTGSERERNRESSASLSIHPPLSLSRCSLGDVWLPSLKIMTRLPVIFYFTARPRKRREEERGEGRKRRTAGKISKWKRRETVSSILSLDDEEEKEGWGRRRERR